MSHAIPSHGTIVAFRQTPGGPFVDIAEVRDITFPRTSRKPFPIASHRRRLDRYVMGSLRRDVLTFDMNFLPKNETHDHLTGLYHHLIGTSERPIRFERWCDVWVSRKRARY